MSTPRPVVPIYLRNGPEPIFALLNIPAEKSAPASPVLICPPFGWDDICSYRSRRDWAVQLAAGGHATLRIDLPGTGDSGGSPHDPNRLAAWTGAVTMAAERMREITGSDRLTAIGIGLGGLLIFEALAQGAQIDELILWAVPASGRTFLRELRVFARLEDSEFDVTGELEPSLVPEGCTGAGGFLLSAETTKALQKIDIGMHELPAGLVTRALLLGRDGIGVDPGLVDCLEEMGTTVTQDPGPGYGAMMAKPHLARAPTEVFAHVSSWLEEHPSKDVTPAPIEPRGALDRDDAIELSVGDARIRETPVTVAQSFGDLFGVLSEPLYAPQAQLCVVMLNAGAIRRVGPNRMWVEAARRWAARGVTTLRLDLEGIGDAEGDADRFTELAELYVPELVDQVRAALDALGARGFEGRFVLMGLCSGAYWSFHGALRDDRVVAAFMLNPRALFWDPALETARDLRRGVLRTSSWPKILRGEVPLARMIALALDAPFTLPRRTIRRRRARRGGDELDRALDRLRHDDKHLQFLFSGNEPLYEELASEGRLDRLHLWPNIRLEMIPGRDHTLRPFQAQQRAHEALDRALEEELQRTVDEAPSALRQP